MLTGAGDTSVENTHIKTVGRCELETEQRQFSDSCVSLTDAGVIGLWRHEGMKTVLCLLKEVFEHIVQGGGPHLQRRGHAKTSRDLILDGF